MNESWSRLDLVGEYTAETPFRIGTGDGGLLLDAAGRPLIPASSFRGALRAYIESVLRGMNADSLTTRHYLLVTREDGQPMPVIRQVALCCDSVDKRADDAEYQGCLTEAIVTRWSADAALRTRLDSELIACTCRVCRVFGASWLAGRVSVADLTLIDSSWDGAFTGRGGATIQRDTGTLVAGSGYARQAIPAGTRFRFRLSMDNATFAEQGMVLLGLRAFSMGLIALGADRSRGLGRGRLELDWWNCRYLDATNLVGTLLGDAPAPFTETDAEARLNALAELLNGLT